MNRAEEVDNKSRQNITTHSHYDKIMKSYRDFNLKFA